MPEPNKDDSRAFPFVSHGGFHKHQHCEPGMSLRAYIATACLNVTAAALASSSAAARALASRAGR